MNQLFYHHQMALIAADRRPHRAGEAFASFDLPDHYARRINQFRENSGLEPEFVGYNGANARQAVAQAASRTIVLDAA